MGKGGGSSGGSSGTNTVVNNSSPPPEFLAAYQHVQNLAQAQQQQPLQQYQGQIVAPFNSNQNQAFGMIGSGADQLQNVNGIAQPYINAAVGQFGQATNPLWDNIQQFSGDNVNQYASPYTQNVIDATQAQFNTQNAVQGNDLIGKAINSGAWGGDRADVALAALGGEQQRNQAPVIAGLYNQGYAQALDEFNKQQQTQLSADQANAWLSSQAAFGLGQLGAEDQSTQIGGINAGLQGANALLGAGQLQQVQQQQELNIPYQQFIQQQAYPWQTISWLADLSTGLGSGAGGTSTTTYPQVGQAAQILGGLGAGAGIFGQLGGFNALGSLFGGSGGGSPMSGFIGGSPIGGYGGMSADMGGLWYNRGGRLPQRMMRRAGGGIVPHSAIIVPRRAYGGIVPLPHRANGGPFNENDYGWGIDDDIMPLSTLPFGGGGGDLDVPDVSMSVVPSTHMEHGRGPPSAPPVPAGIMGGQASGGGGGGGGSGGGGKASGSGGSGGGDDDYMKYIQTAIQVAGIAAMFLNRGGRVTKKADGGYVDDDEDDSGGYDDDNDYDGGDVETLGYEGPFPPGGDEEDGIDFGGPAQASPQQGGIAGTQIAQASPQQGGIAGSKPNPYANTYQPREPSKRAQDAAERAKWNALIAGGARMMSTPGQFGVALGHGLQTGLKAYTQGRDKADTAAEREDEQIDTGKYRKAGLDQRAAQLSDAAQAAKDRLAATTQHYADQAEHQNRQDQISSRNAAANERRAKSDEARAGKGIWEPVRALTNPDGSPLLDDKGVPQGILRDRQTGQEKQGAMIDPTLRAKPGATQQLITALIQSGSAADEAEALRMIHDPTGKNRNTVDNQKERLAQQNAKFDVEQGKFKSMESALKFWRSQYGLADQQPTAPAGAPGKPADPVGIR